MSFATPHQDHHSDRPASSSFDPQHQYSHEPVLSPGTRAEQSDLDPAAFLKSVRELSEKRDREDAERYRRLEEEIEKGRVERAKRREERARSISPEKVDVRSLANADDLTDPPASSTPSSAMEKDVSRRPASGAEEVPEFRGFGYMRSSQDSTPSAQSSAQAPESKPPTSATSLARSGTLSWQRRPTSRAGGSRPMSMAGAESSSHARDSSAKELSREDIAASLGAKDPSYFKQTPDRGVSNAAHKKSQGETTSGGGTALGRRGLPGMSRESPTTPARELSPSRSESIRSDVVSRPDSARDSTFSNARFSTTRTSTSSKPDLKSLIAADQDQDKAAPMSERSSSIADEDQSYFGRQSTMSSSQARIANATERPSSPTKGMGGFVQSAMMRRSDSASKRWSGQPASGISRQNSVLSSTSGYGGLQGSHSMPRMEPSQAGQDRSESPSRPSSSGSNLTATQARDDRDVLVKPGRPAHSRSKSVASNYSTSVEEGHTSPPSSPTKRYRSPTKSSWLESAITSKPESPKPAAPRNSQPSWMADIAKAKAQRQSQDITPTLGGSPRPEAGDGSRPSSPTREVFGHSILRRGSKDVGRPPSRVGLERPPSGPSSPVKSAFGREGLRQTESDNKVEPKPSVTSPPVDLKPLGSSSKPDALAEVIEEPPKPSNTDDGKTEDLPEPTTEPKKEAEPKPEPKFEPTSRRDESPRPEPLAPSKPLDAAKPAPLATINKSRPGTPSSSKPETTSPKPATDFRSNLRSRPRAESKQQDAPEFLSRFGQLRKTQTQNYVAPDVLKDNITRGKNDLAKTDGPIKTPRKDELKESLLAKKEQWKQEKADGVVHERKGSGPPPPAQKPEALAKREGLGKSDSLKNDFQGEKPKEATPEALARQASLKDKPSPRPEPQAETKPEQKGFPALRKQTSEPSTESVAPQPLQPKKQTSTPLSATPEPKQTEASKLAARFNPGLAGILARGPPGATSGSSTPPRSESPGTVGGTPAPVASPPTEPSAESGQLQDMRKGRAKGPKKRAGGAAAKGSGAESPVKAEPLPASEPPTVSSPEPVESPISVQKAKPRAPAGSAASVLMASLQKSSAPAPIPAPIPEKTEKPATPVKSSSLSGSKPEVKTATPRSDFESKPAPPVDTKPALAVSPPKQTSAAQTFKQDTVPEFKGFGSLKKSAPAAKLEDDKENAGESSPSVKSAASSWGRQSPPKKSEPPTQVQLPSKRDEEAAMRSAGLLASSPSRPGSGSGPGISLEKNQRDSSPTTSATGVPPKPTKSSRIVSGQLQEASPNKDTAGIPTGEFKSEIEQELRSTFGCVPTAEGKSMIDTAAAVANSPHQERSFKTLRKWVQVAAQDGSLQQLPQHEEYTFFDECVYICTHAYTVGNGAKKTEIFLWTGTGSSESSVDQAHATTKKLAKEAGNAFVHAVRQGLEPPGFLQALGGILVTRRGARESAPKQYMLCGRKHLGQIVFDEVDFGPHSLCPGYAYLVSYPVTLQETKLYLWKGRGCSIEELSAARLAAMDLSAAGEIIEVDDGAEFSSFLKAFGPNMTKPSLASAMSDPDADRIWRLKAAAPAAFAPRLFRFAHAEPKPAGLLTSFFSRRPSWGARSASPPQPSNGDDGRPLSPDVKVEAKELSPFTPADFDPEALHMVDACATLYLVSGPLFASSAGLSEGVRALLLSQALVFAAEYAAAVVTGTNAAGAGVAEAAAQRPEAPKVEVLFSGVPDGVKRLLRGWEEGRGLWGTAGLMAGSAGGGSGGGGVKTRGLEEVVAAL